MNWISTSDYGKLMIGEPELLVFLVLINSFMSLTKWKVLTDTFLLPFFRQQKTNKEHQLLCILNISSSCRIYHHPSRRPTEVSQFCAARIASKCKNENVERKQKQVDTQLIFVHLLKFLFPFFSFFAHFWLFNNFYCFFASSVVVFPWLLACFKMTRPRDKRPVALVFIHRCSGR